LMYDARQRTPYGKAKKLLSFVGRIASTLSPRYGGTTKIILRAGIFSLSDMHPSRSNYVS
jgi:hypothetical protein